MDRLSLILDTAALSGCVEKLLRVARRRDDGESSRSMFATAASFEPNDEYAASVLPKVLPVKVCLRSESATDR